MPGNLNQPAMKGKQDMNMHMMQYALLERNEDIDVLMDWNEIQALKSEKPIIENKLDESSFKLRIFYGFYYQQIARKFTEDEVSSHINYSINKWLIHLSGLRGIYLGIDEIMLLKKKPNKTAFAALVSAPNEFQLNSEGQAKTAFVRYHDLSIKVNLLNRLGLFSFVREEKRNVEDLTELNWKDKVDKEKAIRDAFSIY